MKEHYETYEEYKKFWPLFGRLFLERNVSVGVLVSDTSIPRTEARKED
jgi:hypothetical protein